MDRPTQVQFDAVQVELLWRRLISLVDEAAAALVRTSFSTLVRESYDFSCIVTDAAGEALVQATESIPSFIGTPAGDRQAFPQGLSTRAPCSRRRADHQ